jgi:hypothetical protein
MKKKKSRRAGATVTFSVSVDPETKKALRLVADQDFGGNLSALVTEMGAQARRRLAAGAYLKRHGLKVPTSAEVDAIEHEIQLEVMAWKNRRRKHRVA